MHLDLFVIDDSTQNKPTRPGMGKLVAVGSIHAPGENVRDLESDLEALCKKTGFPDGPTGEFKWSPGKELWMHKGLVNVDRTKFYKRALKLAREADCTVMVMMEDATKKPANVGKTPEQDVVLMFLERVQAVLESWPARAGIVLADRPSAEEDKFLLACLEVLQQGTDFTVPVNVAFNVVATSSHLVRLLQLADLVTSCSVAFVSGEPKWSPPIFQKILPMVRTEYDRKGGCGIKIHPDFRYRNLYHWLFGDEDFVRYQTGWPLPEKARSYFSSADTP